MRLIVGSKSRPPNENTVHRPCSEYISGDSGPEMRTVQSAERCSERREIRDREIERPDLKKTRRYLEKYSVGVLSFNRIQNNEYLCFTIENHS